MDNNNEKKVWPGEAEFIRRLDECLARRAAAERNNLRANSRSRDQAGVAVAVANGSVVIPYEEDELDTTKTNDKGREKK